MKFKEKYNIELKFTQCLVVNGMFQCLVINKML